MDLQSLYKSRQMEPAEMARAIQPGWVCCADIAGAYPAALLAAIASAAGDALEDITLHSLLDTPPDPLRLGEVPGVRPVSWFSGGGLRQAVQAGRGDVMPCYYRDMPGLFTRYVRPDAFFTTVSPMDRHGYFSTGICASNSAALAACAGRIYLQVNDQMPRCPTGPQIHISQVAGLWARSAPLPQPPAVQPDPVSQTIGGYIAQEVPNGATLQLGIGAVPEAVGLALADKRDLGIHTELFTDSMLTLIEAGAVTNLRKPLCRGRSVATFVYGSRRLYDFVDDNPGLLLLGVDWVNDPAVIARHPDFISVNGAVEVDLFGQVCAESAGTRHLSGTGGQADFVRGAIQSEGGKSFIAFPSTAKGGTVSRICAQLSPGAVVTTSKNDVDYIVTEHGVAKLRGKTLSQRARALIAIAHPRFREALTAQAKARNILI